jgi:hypothetical protein
LEKLFSRRPSPIRSRQFAQIGEITPASRRFPIADMLLRESAKNLRNARHKPGASRLFTTIPYRIGLFNGSVVRIVVGGTSWAKSSCGYLRGVSSPSKTNFDFRE